MISKEANAAVAPHPGTAISLLRRVIDRSPLAVLDLPGAWSCAQLHYVHEGAFPLGREAEVDEYDFIFVEEDVLPVRVVVNWR